MEHDVIVTVSLGATRLLRITGKKDPMDKRIQISLRSGSVFVQKKGAQKALKHEIPKEATVKEERISITFRQLRLPPQPQSTQQRASSTAEKGDDGEGDEGEEEEFYFDYEADEFVAVCAIGRQWSKENKITSISNSSEGEMLADRFRVYVETIHAEVARSVKKDGTIYEAVLMYLNDQDELGDGEEEEGEEKDEEKDGEEEKD